MSAARPSCANPRLVFPPIRSRACRTDARQTAARKASRRRNALRSVLWGTSRLSTRPFTTTSTTETLTALHRLENVLVASSSQAESAMETARQAEAWQEAVTLVQSLGVDSAAADTAIAHAFGWGRQKYWQHEKLDETPNPDRVMENVDYLRSVGFTDEHLRELIEKFPEFLGCDCAERLRPNVKYLQTSFFLKGPHCVKAIMRKPNVLGNVIDCEGDCKGQCTKCWSQF